MTCSFVRKEPVVEKVFRKQSKKYRAKPSCAITNGPLHISPWHCLGFSPASLTITPCAFRHHTRLCRKADRVATVLRQNYVCACAVLRSGRQHGRISRHLFHCQYFVCVRFALAHSLTTTFRFTKVISCAGILLNSTRKLCLRLETLKWQPQRFPH